MTLRVSLLGPVIVEVAGRPLDVDTRKAVAVLAYLACARAPVPRETLSFLLWPDSSEERSRAALRRTLSVLRKGLGPGRLVSDRSTAALDRADCHVDVDHFEMSVRHGDDPAADAVGAWQRAVELYRGDFMAGFAIRGSPEFDDWQRSQAGHFRRLAAKTLDRLASAQATRGLLREAVEAGTRRLELDALHEPAHRHLMMLHAAAGDRPSAILQYRECVRILDEELGVPPLDETTELYRKIVEGAVAVAPLPEPLLSRGSPSELATVEQPSRLPLVGRGDELETMAASYRAATAGLRFVAVTGEPGIGKTRLIDEFVGSFPAKVARAASYQGEAEIPHGTTIELLRSGLDGADHQLSALPSRWLAEAGRLVPELLTDAGTADGPPPLDSPGGYQRLLEGSARVLVGMVGGAGPGVLVLDDAHWADEDSLRLLGMLIKRLSDEPALVAIAFRDGEVTADHPLSLVLRAARRTGILTTIALTRLGSEDVAELVHRYSPGRAGSATEVFELSEGVPLFVAEFLALLGDKNHLGVVPSGIRDLLNDQIDRLSELSRQLLGAAAAIGRSFDSTTLKEAAGRTDEETVAGLEELMQAGLVREVGAAGSFDFDHEQLRRLTYESLSLVRRRLLHGRIADSEQARLPAADGGLGAAALAGHLEAAGRDREAADQHLVAAVGAARLYANHQALRHYEAALGLGHEDTAEIRAAVGDLHALAGRYPEAIANLQAASSGYGGAHRAALERKMGVVYTRAGDWELAEAAFESASAGLEGDPAAESRLLTDWAWLAHRRDDDPRAAELARRALVQAVELADPLAVAQAHNVMGIVERVRNPEAAVSHHEQSRELAAGLDLTVHAAALNNLAVSLLACGRPSPGLGFALEALAITEQLGDRHKEAAVHSNIADLLHALGRDEEAWTHLRRSAGVFADVGGRGEPLEPEIWMLTTW